MGDKVKKIGIMGGTFNPIHFAHLLLAERAAEACGLDEVWFMPLRQPPHKKTADLASPEARLAMVTLAIQGNERFAASDFELNRAGMTYTADTLRALTAAYPNTRFTFILGGDSLLQFENWREPEVIVSLAALAAATREGAGVDTCEVRAAITRLQQRYQADISYFDMPELEISSAQLRARAAAGRSIRYLTPQSVCAYIDAHGLYRCE